MMNGIIGIFFLTLFFYLFWKYIKARILPKPSPTHSYTQEVVGEASYIDNLRKIVGTSGKEVRLEGLTATLVHEPDNQHDSNAVAIKINGMVVGYLPRAAAKKHIATIKDTITCPAIIIGGGKDRPNYGVWLSYKI